VVVVRAKNAADLSRTAYARAVKSQVKTASASRLQKIKNCGTQQSISMGSVHEGQPVRGELRGVIAILPTNTHGRETASS